MAKSYKTLYDNIARFGDALSRRDADVKSLCAGEKLAFNPLISELDTFKSGNDIYDWFIVQSREKELHRQLRQIDIAIDKIKTATKLIKLQEEIADEMDYEKFDLCVSNDKTALQFLFTQTSLLGQTIQDYTPNLTRAVVKFHREFSKVATDSDDDYRTKSTSWIIRAINESRVRFVELGYEGLKLKADKVMQYTQQASFLMEAMERGIITNNGAANDLWAYSAMDERVSESKRMVSELYIGSVTLKHFLVEFNDMDHKSDTVDDKSNAVDDKSDTVDHKTGKAVKTEPKNYYPASILPFAQKPA